MIEPRIVGLFPATTSGIAGDLTMPTYVPKKNDVTPKWYVVDADGIALGRVATQVATLLRGKHRPTFTPYLDTGDHVIVLNAAKIQWTGKKLEQKVYRHYT